MLILHKSNEIKNCLMISMQCLHTFEPTAAAHEKKVQPFLS